MDFSISPYSNIWQSGMINVPKVIIDKYLKFASEYQLKSLMIILSNGGTAEARDIQKALGIPLADVNELMDFWISEGIVETSKADKVSAPPVKKPASEKTVATPTEPKKTAPKKEIISPPHLAPKDIVDLARSKPEIALLLDEGQTIMGRTISGAERELFVNMHTFYGLSVEVIMTILQYYRQQKESGRVVGVSYIQKLADNWAEEGINDISAAEEKLRELESSDTAWNKITALAGIRHRQPTSSQRDMIKFWTDNFQFDMIDAACDIMKETIEKPSLKYIDGIIKSWMDAGIKTRSDLALLNAQTKEAKKASPKTNKKHPNHLMGEPSYDMNQIISDTKDNTDIKI